MSKLRQILRFTQRGRGGQRSGHPVLLIGWQQLKDNHDDDAEGSRGAGVDLKVEVDASC